MNCRLVVSVFVLLAGRYAIAQSILVNPDGTHSVIQNQGMTSIVVNPNGTHSVLFNNGSTSIMVNPDGTHTAIFRQENTAAPNGGHSILVKDKDMHPSDLSAASNTHRRNDKKKEARLKQAHKIKRKTSNK